jgi:ATP-binding cassette subfamily B protein
VKDADQIVVLHEGKVAEQGTHDELVALGGIYAELYRKQLLEEELEQL